MTSDLFRRYVWLVDLLRHSPKMTFEEIAAAWNESGLNTDKSPLVLRTFHNHRNAIEKLFGIEITCDRSCGNRYAIDSSDSITSSGIKAWMLQTISLTNMISDAEEINNRIQIEFVPTGKQFLGTIIEAIRNNNALEVEYIDRQGLIYRDLVIEPYCIKFTKRHWFVLANIPEANKIVPFYLYSFTKVKTSDQQFIYPLDFSPDEYFDTIYGSIIDYSRCATEIKIKFYGNTRDKIIHNPLHKSQKEIIRTADYSVLQYYLIPSFDFICDISQFDIDAEVIEPAEIRNRITDHIKTLHRHYCK